MSSPPPDSSIRIQDPVAGSPNPLDTEGSLSAPLHSPFNQLQGFLLRCKLLAVLGGLPAGVALVGGQNPDFCPPIEGEDICISDSTPPPSFSLEPSLQERSPYSTKHFIQQLEAYSHANPPSLLEVKQLRSNKHPPTEMLFSPQEQELILRQCKPGPNPGETEDLSSVSFHPFCDVNDEPQRESKVEWRPEITHGILEVRQGTETLLVRSANLNCDLVHPSKKEGAAGMFFSNADQPFILIGQNNPPGTREHEAAHFWVYKHFINAYLNSDRFFPAQEIYDENERNLMGLNPNELVSFRQLNEMFAIGEELSGFPIQKGERLLLSNADEENSIYHMGWKMDVQLSYLSNGKLQAQPSQAQLEEKLLHLDLNQYQIQSTGLGIMALAEQGMEKMELILRPEECAPEDWRPSFELSTYEQISLQVEKTLDAPLCNQLEEEIRGNPYAGFVFAPQLMQCEKGLALISNLAQSNPELALLILVEHKDEPALVNLTQTIAKVNFQAAMEAHQRFVLYGEWPRKLEEIASLKRNQSLSEWRGKLRQLSNLDFGLQTLHEMGFWW